MWCLLQFCAPYCTRGKSPEEVGVKTLPFRGTAKLAIQPDMLYLGLDIFNLLLESVQGKRQRETQAPSQPHAQEIQGTGKFSLDWKEKPEE